jgi:TorA-specific chaperone
MRATLTTPAAHPAATPTLADLVNARAAVLELIARLFAAPPTAAVVAALRRVASGAVLAELPDDGTVHDGLAPLLAALAEPEDDATLALELERSFGVLFLGLAGPRTVPPYESAWRGNGRLFQQPVADMNALLAELDIRAELAGEPADHVAIETGLLAQLVADAHPERAALADRLAAWLPGFQDALVVTDPTGFYAGAATALLTAVERERAL